MSFMAERPTGALRDAEDPGFVDDGSVDDAEEADPDANPPEGWIATHFSAGGGEARDADGNVVVVDADGNAQTFLVSDTGVANPATLGRASGSGAQSSIGDPSVVDDEDE
jgi:hypothetical protein